MLPYLSFNFLTNLSSFCYRNTLKMFLPRLPCLTESDGHLPFLTSRLCLTAPMFLHLSSLSSLDTPPPDFLSTSSLLNVGSSSSVCLSSARSSQDSVPGPCFWHISGWMGQTSTTLPGNYFRLQSFKFKMLPAHQPTSFGVCFRQLKVNVVKRKWVTFPLKLLSHFFRGLPVQSPTPSASQEAFILKASSWRLFLSL